MNKYCRVFFGVLILISFPTTIFAGTPVQLYESFAGNINYIVTAGTLRTQPNSINACSVTNSGSASLSGLPAGATVLAAYLYWAGSYSTQTGSTRTTPDFDITFETQNLTADRTFTETFYYDATDTDYDYFSGVKDVTGIVSAKGSGTYTFSNLSVNTGTPHCASQAVLSGWSLVVIYEDAGEYQRVVNLFDGFMYHRGSEITLTLSNFRIPATPVDGKMSHISWEGDVENSDPLNGFTENLIFNGNQLTDGYNPANNQFNSTINTLGTSASYGVDVDTYDTNSYLNPGDTSYIATFRTGGDLVLLSAEIISVTNTDICDLSITKSHTGDFVVGQTGEFRMAVSNNGPNDSTEVVTVTDSLPAGLSYVSSSGEGWTVDSSAAPLITWTHNGPLPAGSSLPEIVLQVLVDAAAYPGVSNTATVSSPTFDNIGSNNSSTDTVGIADLGVVKTSDSGGLVQAGDTIQYEIGITNMDSVAHNDVAVEDALPSGVSYVPESTSVTVESTISATFRDEFNAIAYNNNNGTAAWSTNWLEINESDGANNGDEAVVTNLSSYVLRIQDNDGSGEGVQRGADLSAYTAASLSFQYRRDALDNANDYVTIAVSRNGGSSWTELGRFAGPTNDSNYVNWSMDITTYISSNTRIRFLSSPSLGGSDRVYFDNIEIVASNTAVTTYTNAAGDPNQLADGVPPNLVVPGDGFSILPGRIMTVSYRVNVDNPLDAGIDRIINTATVTTDLTPVPIHASVTDYVPHLSSYESDYATEDNIYYRDPAGTGAGNDVVFTGGTGWVPGTPYDVAYYDASGLLIVTDTDASAGSDAFLRSSYDNSNDIVTYGLWTSVVVPNGISPQSDLASQLSNPSTIVFDQFTMRSWSLVSFTDASGIPVNGYDIPGGSNKAYVRIIDPDQNTDPNTAESITVTIIVTDSSSLPINPRDTEDIVLAETGPNTGIFVYSSGMDISYGSGSPNDGILNVSGDEYLYIRYTDPSDSGDSSEVFAYIPTLAVLSSFRVMDEDGKAVVEWETTSEIGTLGFYLYRKDIRGRDYKRLNSRILPGLLVSCQGGTYRYVDETAIPGATYTYRVVEKEFKGHERVHGPYTVIVGKEETYFSQKRSPDLLKQENIGRSDGRMFKMGHSGYACKPRKMAEVTMRRLQAFKTLRRQHIGVNKQIIGTKAKIVITESGIYLLKASEIAEVLNVPEWMVKRWIRRGDLSLSSNGRKVPWKETNGDTGLYFFGQSIDSPYTDQNVYWLKQGKGLKMKVAQNGVPGGIYPDQVFQEIVHAEENHFPMTALFDDPHADFWLWDYIVGGIPGLDEKDFKVNLDGVSDVSADDMASLSVYLQGVSDDPNAGNDHHVEIHLNGNFIGEGRWNGTDAWEYTFAVDQALLNEGENTVTVKGFLDTGAEYSFFYVDSFNLTYQRSYRAVNNRLIFPGSESESVTVHGFLKPEIMVFDITDPDQPSCIRGTAMNEGNTFSVSFHSYDSSRKFIALTEDVVKMPDLMTTDNDSSLKRRANRADYLVITPVELETGARELADYRKSLGMETRVILLEDIMDEFNYGISSPEAVRSFLSYAHNAWDKAPEYVVLAGDGTYDYKNFQNVGDNLNPPFLTVTPFGLFTSDTRFVDIENDDGVPEMAVGRIPVITIEDFLLVVDKIRAYENCAAGAWSNKVVMLADNPDNGGNFPNDSDEIAGLLPVEYSSLKIYLSEMDVDSARSDLFEEINNGAILINYLGHGAITNLANEGLLTTDDMPHLNGNDQLPVMAMLTCVAGRFSIPGYDSLGEVLLLEEDKGAVGVLAPTGLSMNAQAVILDQEFFREVFQNGEKRLGKAIQKAMNNYRRKDMDKNILYIYSLLGDPALRIK